MLEVEKYKTGIKIKKSNRGKFTSYCGGEVTSACILRGKNSSNPAVRKRATFAANARKWKHQYGGVLLNDATRVAPFLGTPLSLHPEFQEISNNYINSIGHLAYGVLRFLPCTRWATDALDVSGLSPDIQKPDYTDITQGVGHVGRGMAKTNKLKYENLQVGLRHKIGLRKRHPTITVTPSFKNDGILFFDKVGNGFKHLGLIGLFGDIKLEILNYNDVIKFKLQYNDKLDSIRFYNRPPLLILLRHLQGGIIKGLDGLVAKQDNTRVARSITPIRIARRSALDQGSRKLASGFNWIMGKIGDVFAGTVSNLAVPSGSATGANVYANSPMYRYNLTHVQPEARKVVDKAAPYVSVSNYVAALTQGSLNPKVGAEVLSRDPRLLSLGIIGDIAAFKYAPKVLRATPAAVDRGLAATGNKGAKSRVIAREIDRGVADATKNGQIEVTSNYFNAPDKWYRITERPEKIGIEEQGKNVTTADSPETLGTINGWRTSVLDNAIETGKGVNEGYFVKKPKKININIRRTHGRAHGNTSQAAKGQLWQANTANSNIFPGGVIEGEAPLTIPYGLSRTHFVNTPWEEVPTGGRIGFHTGEMPLGNLGWFQKTNKGTYTYESVIPEKRITVDKGIRLLGSLPRLLSSNTYPWYTGPRFSILSVVNPDGTVNPRLAMRVQHTVADNFGQGAHRMENRLENSRWHKDDPTTYDHTRNVAQSAWRLPTPEGFTKQDQMIAALGHDFGKMISGDGHAQIGADLARQVFPDLTEAQYKAIAEHMGWELSSPLSEVTKAADITNGRSFSYLQRYAPLLYDRYAPKINRSITFMYPFPEVPPRLQPYILAARQAKEQNIQNLAQQAKDYANSPLRKALDLQLNLEAHDLGFLENNESLQFMLPNNKPPKIQIHDEQIPGENAGVNGNYVDATNTINLTGASAQGFTPFHEHLHYYGIGANPIITLTKLGRLFYNVQPDGIHGKPLIETDAVFDVEGTRKRSGYYREHKLDEVLDQEEMQKLNGNDYEYIRSEELPVHGLTTGKELGIEPFSPYPGDAAMPGIVNKAVTKNPWLRVVKHSNPVEFLNFWKLLTGSYLGLNTPLIFKHNEEK